MANAGIDLRILFDTNLTLYHRATVLGQVILNPIKISTYKELASEIFLNIIH